MSLLPAGCDNEPAGTALCLGVFDGVHKGHQALVAHCVAAAVARNLIPQALSFDPHPAAFFGKTQAQHLLTLPARRAELLRNLGAANTIFAPFDQEFSQQTPEQFVDWIANDLQAQLVVTGPDYRFGHRRLGTTKTLHELGVPRFECLIIDEVGGDGLRYRSSEVRQALQDGDLARVRLLTGRDFDFSGAVVPGKGQGRSLGFATANLAVDARQMLPPDGVYALRVEGRHGGFDGVMNLGRAPTVRGEQGQRIPEVHLLDFEGDLYGETLRVQLVKRLRLERRFDSLAALKGQISEDVAAARRALS